MSETTDKRVFSDGDDIEEQAKYTFEDFQKELSQFHAGIKKTNERAKTLRIVHEAMIIVERIDMEKLSTWLALDGQADEDRIRESFMGRVVAISECPCDEVVNWQKTHAVKIGDVVNYVPDSAYSLNVEDEYALWGMRIDNILIVDTTINYEEKIESLLAQKLQRLGGEEEYKKYESMKNSAN